MPSLRGVFAPGNGAQILQQGAEPRTPQPGQGLLRQLPAPRETRGAAGTVGKPWQNLGKPVGKVEKTWETPRKMRI